MDPRKTGKIHTRDCVDVMLMLNTGSVNLVCMEIPSLQGLVGVNEWEEATDPIRGSSRNDTLLGLIRALGAGDDSALEIPYHSLMIPVLEESFRVADGRVVIHGDPKIMARLRMTASLVAADFGVKEMGEYTCPIGSEYKTLVRYGKGGESTTGVWESCDDRDEFLESLIDAFSVPGCLVFVPFSRDGAAVHAAYRKGREWIGADLGLEARVEAEKRFSNEFLFLDLEEMFTADLPEPRNEGKYSGMAKLVGDHRTNRFGDMIRVEQAHGRRIICNGCGDDYTDNLANIDVDHIRREARSSALWNLQLLCGACNRMKGKGTFEKGLARWRRKGTMAQKQHAAKVIAWIKRRNE